MTYSYSEKQGKKNKKILFFSFLVSIFLCILKSIFGVLSGSIALLSSALDSFMDAFSTGINYFVMYHSSKPADKEHPFGHGKFEAFSSLLQSLIISITAFILIVYSLLSLFSHKDIQENNITNITFLVVILSIFSPLFLSLYIKKKSNSDISSVMHAEYSHFWSDGILNFGVFISILSVYFFHLVWLDNLIGIAISFFLLKEAYSLFIESFNILTDREIDEKIVKKIENILNNAGEIAGWHAMRTRQSGSEYHIDVHLEFSEDITVKTAHNISHDIENKIIEKYENAIILTHFDYRNDMK